MPKQSTLDIIFVHSKTQYLFFNYNLNFVKWNISLLSESNFIFQDKKSQFHHHSLKVVFFQYQISSFHNSKKKKLLMFLNMVLCQLTTTCSCQTPQRGKGLGAEGGEGSDLRLISFPVWNFQGSSYCHLSKTSFTRENVFPSVAF